MVPQREDMRVVPAEAVPGPGRAEEVVWGTVVGEEMERGQEMERAGEGMSRGSIEALGRWREEKKKPRDAPQVSGRRRWNR